MKQFDVPAFYRSEIISKIKEIRKANDPLKKDFSPSVLDFGSVKFLISRHFGFCYGVENAIEISYKAIEENPDKRIFLLSEMIHNPEVNADLQSRGVRFLMDTKGNKAFDWSELTPDDIVVIPAFGTTIEIQKTLEDIGVNVSKYNTTCPFVERVWKMSAKLGKGDYTIIIHGKQKHEETRATFSHAKEHGPSLIIRDIEEAKELAKVIRGEVPKEDFYRIFEGRYSEGFDVEKHLERLGVVNQTTMLATETKEIASFLKAEIIEKNGEEGYKHYFADTRDSLCYATNDNQNSTYGLLEQEADLAIVVGGYNSSNTTHLVELCEDHCQTYFINNADNIKSKSQISHFDYRTKEVLESDSFIPEKDKVSIILTSGASCPDATVDSVLRKVLSFFEDQVSLEDVLKKLVNHV